MSLIDAVGFYVNVSILLADQDPLTIGVVVAGCAAVAVVLPTLLGSALRRRREGNGGSLPLLVAVSLAWTVLGAVMIVVRLTSENVTAGGDGGLEQAAAAGTNPYTNAIVATLFFLVYFTTGLLAFVHAFAAEDRRAVAAAHRKRSAAWAWLYDRQRPGAAGQAEVGP
jgi:hypothetical protein